MKFAHCVRIMKGAKQHVRDWIDRVSGIESLNYSIIQCFVIACVGLLAIGVVTLMHDTGTAVAREVASASPQVQSSNQSHLNPNPRNEPALVSHR